MDEEQFDSYSKKVLKFLDKKAPKFRCPACQNDDFSLVKGYHVHNLQNQREAIGYGGGALAVTVVCKNCGLMFDFSTKVIDDEYQKRSA